MMGWLTVKAPQLPRSREMDIERGLPASLPEDVGIGSVYENDDGEHFLVEGFIESKFGTQIIWGLSYPGSIW